MDYHNLCLGCMEEKGTYKTCPHCGLPAGAGPESALHLPPGTVLDDKYLIGRALGQGGFGITYLAWDNNLKIKLAIKEYLPQQLAYRSDGKTKVVAYKQSLSKEFSYGREKFLEEAQTLARFNEHPNIVSVRDYFEANNTAYLVMNYHEGVTLKDFLTSTGGKITLEQTLLIFLPVLDALKEVHAAGILHRDISPDNLLIDRNARIILIDFGAARKAMGVKSRSLSVIMKAGYSPLEQYQSRGKQGPWTDIYAVAATMYRALTGEAPLEAIDRMAEDDMMAPSQLGVVIEPDQEKALLKALAVKDVERFQAVEEFQSALLGFGQDLKKADTFVKSGGTTPFVKLTTDQAPPEKPTVEIEKELAHRQTVSTASGNMFFKNSKEAIIYAVALIAVVLLLSGVGSLLGGGFQSDAREIQQASQQEEAEAVILDLITHSEPIYTIDYENGTIPIGDLPIGTRIIDSTWEWEHRLGINYCDKDWDGSFTPKGEVKPVAWIVVAHDHYDLDEEHVTLLSEEIIGRYSFDNSSHVTVFGYNHWGESGTHSSADCGLRPWLNSNGIHAGEGFYQAFSDNFKRAVLTTTVLNKEWENGSTYSISDNVFIPSTSELGDTAHGYTYQIGHVYPYFQGAANEKRVAKIGGETKWYWTRSPASLYGYIVRYINSVGGPSGARASSALLGVRPILNLKSDTLASEVNP